MRPLFDPVAPDNAKRGDRLRGMPCRAAALPGRAGGARLWSGRPHGGVAAEIWAADRARAADGAVDGAPARRAGRYRRGTARYGAFATLADLVARVQPGRVAPRRHRPEQEERRVGNR